MSEFSAAFDLFLSSGDFLKLTSRCELGIPSVQHFPVNNATATLLDTGVLLFEPDNIPAECKDVLISCGIHGNETAPIEIVNQLVMDIVKGGGLVKQRTLFILGNPVAMNMSKRFEVENLNRLFCGKYQNITPCYERRRAGQLERYVSDFFSSAHSKKSIKYHYDLHTAIKPSKYEKFAIYPYQNDKPWDKGQLAFLQSSGINTILFGHAPSGTFSYFTSSNFNAHAFTVELGKVMPFGENNMANFEAIKNNLQALIQDDKIELNIFDNANFNLFKVLGDIPKITENFVLHLDDDISNFTYFEIGTLLAEDNGYRYQTSETGESIVFPNPKVANGQRAALIVVPTTL